MPVRTLIPENREPAQPRGQRGNLCGGLTLDLLELHAVVERAELGVLGKAITHLRGLGGLGDLLDELVVDRLVDEGALDGAADLARVGERPREDLRRHLLDVDIASDDRGVIAAELERHALDVVGRGRHDLLARGDGAGERHLSTEIVGERDLP